jgi:hypothetical protein
MSKQLKNIIKREKKAVYQGMTMDGVPTVEVKPLTAKLKSAFKSIGTMFTAYVG